MGTLKLPMFRWARRRTLRHGAALGHMGGRSLNMGDCDRLAEHLTTVDYQANEVIFAFWEYCRLLTDYQSRRGLSLGF